ncbi:hypothetical protein OO013_03865 [Mangrovivirga sp. M17]|uniref:Uncharacterized protein n=1 Tax=Mangrovivirga halotolerans TaxID=2993936 RepID=A0ABT3RND9_9BACT|nr:hypothetical protein [Mangrovivirga halotolerans]MCX2742986.1 hypothetical protein [Mangrovivirga halotolerans]
MLGFIFLFWIGKYFYNLAERFGRSKWGYAILGIVVYYTGTIIGGFLLGISEVIFGTTFFTDLPDIVFNLIALPFGLIFNYILYKILENAWEKRGKIDDLDTLDGGMINKG